MTEGNNHIEEKRILDKSKEQIITFADRISALAKWLMALLKKISIAAFISGCWIWFVLFHSAFLAFSWITILTLPIFIFLCIPSALLYRVTLNLEELVFLPREIRDNVTLTLDEAKKVKSTLSKEESGELSLRRGLLRSIRSMKIIFEKIMLLKNVKGMPLSVLKFWNPIQKILALAGLISSIVVIVLAILLTIGYGIVLIIFL